MKLWKEKYEIGHCLHCCDSWIIIYPVCKNTSCNAGSCPECHDDFTEFTELKTSPIDFLSEEEIRVFNRIDRLRNIIAHCLENGREPIDWAWLKENGKLAPYDKKEFANFIP